MNPFLGKSLTEWRDGVPGYSGPELSALAACVCDEEWVRPVMRQYHDCIDKFTVWQRHCIFPAPFHLWYSVLRYTADWREAGRLMVKYQLTVRLYKDGWGCRGDYVDDFLRSKNPCRAITEAAVIAGLTKWIEGRRE